MEKPSTEIKLIAIDIDGTLLTPDGYITPRTRAAIQAAQDAGIIVTLATARRYIGAQAIATALGIELPLIVYDGALIVSHPSQVILASQTLTPALVQQVIAVFRQHHIQPIIQPCESERCVNEEVWTGLAEHDNPGLATYLLVAADRTRRMAYELLHTNTANVLRVAAFADEAVLQNMLPAIRALPCSWLLASHGSYGSAELAVMQPGCSKASGLAALGAHYGIALEQVMAIGDSYNDLEMLRVAGWGVAMGQAPEAVKATANAITATNLEDGVAVAIERYALAQTAQAELVAPDGKGESGALFSSFNILP